MCFIGLRGDIIQEIDEELGERLHAFSVEIPPFPFVGSEWGIQLNRLGE